MTRSNARDIGKIIRTEGGKFFPATILNTNDSSSIRIPSCWMQAIDGSKFDLAERCRNQTTLLTISGSAYAEPQLESFRNPFLSKYPSGSKREKIQLIDIRPIMTKLKWWIFSSLLKNSSQTIIPSELHDSFIVAYQPIELLEALDVPNYLGSFVYLIDGEAKVRWKASGQATENELQKMHEIIRQLQR